GVGFAHHAGDLADAQPRYALRIAPSRRLSSVARDLGRRYPGQVSQYSYPSRPGDVENLTSLRRFPPVLAGFTALLGIGVLANVLATTRRRRRTELATLRCIGLTPRQTGACVAWQGLCVTVVALGIGIPIGIIAGKMVWAAAARAIHVATD